MTPRKPKPRKPTRRNKTKVLEFLEFETAGFGSGDRLGFRPTARCGKISDGVAFEHNRQGGWLLSFADLKRAYLLAKKHRQDPNCWIHRGTPTK